jgi:hypothetical protein
MRPIVLTTLVTGLLFSISTGPALSQEVPELPPAIAAHGPINPHRNLDGSLKRGQKNQTYSYNWSGYVLNSYQTGQLYSSASATWQVPSVSYAPYNGNSVWQYSVNWVGIGGNCQNAGCTSIDPTLIQLGTGQSASNSGGGYYYAWYELLPANLTVIPNPVNPGDIITATLQCIAACSPSTTQTWELSMVNQTAGWTWTQIFYYQTGMGSAEWIVEAPSTGGILPLANYAQANFAALYANGSLPTLSLSANGIVLQDTWGQTSNPAEVIGPSFSTCWGDVSLTPCTTASFTQPPPATTSPAPSDSLVASPSKITAGQSATLSWTSSNANSCSGGNFTASGTAGSVVVSPGATTTYSVTCTGAGGSVTAQTTVNVSSSTGNNASSNAKKKK